MARDGYRDRNWPTFPGDFADRKRTKRRKPKNEEEWKRNKKDRRARHALRYSRQGRFMEERVAGILEKMRDDGKIHNFSRHAPNSQEDHEGKDFTVSRFSAGEELAEVSFGISISLRSSQGSSLKHPTIPQFHIPINTKDETIEKKVLALFAALPE